MAGMSGDSAQEINDFALIPLRRRRGLTNLAEAVVALNLTGAQSQNSSTDAGTRSETCPSQTIDSGYATASSATSASERNKSQTNSEKEVVPLRRGLLRRRVTKLKAFDKPIRGAVQRRFEDFMEFIKDPFNSWVTESNLRYTAVSVALMTLGETMETAKPWIVVQGDKTVVKKIRQFFTQPHIRSQHQCDEDEHEEPQLDIIYHSRPLRRMAASDFPVWMCPANALSSTTLCGTACRFGNKLNGHVAVIGGVVKVQHRHDFTYYAMTAGHVVCDDWDYEHGTLLAGNENAGRTQFSPALEDFFEPEEDERDSEFELDFDSDHDKADDDAQPMCQIAGRPDSLCDEVCSEMIGVVQSSSYDKGDILGRNLDWALIKLEKPSMYQPNRLPQDMQKFCSAPPNTNFFSDGGLRQAWTTRQVLHCNNISGCKRGTLTLLCSFVMLAPGKTLTRVHKLKFDDQAGKLRTEEFVVDPASLTFADKLEPGDCGTWVIDAEDLKVYGHVIASDAFGNGLVVPIQNTFEDIKAQLSASLVCIPSTGDVITWTWSQAITISKTTSLGQYQDQEASTRPEKGVSKRSNEVASEGSDKEKGIEKCLHHQRFLFDPAVSRYSSNDSGYASAIASARSSTKGSKGYSPTKVSAVQCTQSSASSREPPRQRGVEARRETLAKLEAAIQAADQLLSTHRKDALDSEIEKKESELRRRLADLDQPDAKQAPARDARS